MAKNQVTITFAGDDKSLSKTLGGLDSATNKSSGSLSKLGTVAKGVALGALGGLAVAAKLGFDELADGARKSAQTAAVLKSTGGAAKVTQKEVEGLALALSRKSGVDDQVIQSGQNMLLTFTNVRNEAGKGNNVFDQATSTLLDMSVAMGTDASKTAIQLGKALNDPIKGISALSKVGVTFTQDQKDMIKEMVASGNTMGAQKIILAELNKEFGGSAAAAGKTLPGQLAILKNSFADVAAGLVATLLPGMKVLVGVGMSAVDWMRDHETATKVLVVTIGGLAAAIIGGKGIVSALNTFKSAFGLVNTIMGASPAVRIGLAVAALGAALVAAYQASPAFRRAVQGALNAIRPIAETIAGIFRGIVSAIQTIASWRPGQDAGVKDAGDLQRRLGTKGGLNPALPRRARGGIFSGAQMSVIGEAGPEAVIPLTKPRRANQIMRAAGLGGGGTVINVVVNALDPRAAATGVVRALDEWERRNGQRYARA